MHPVLLKVGPLSVYSFGFFLAIAFLVGIAASLYYARKEHIPSQAILDLAIYVIIAAIVGSRLFYVLGQWEYFLSNPPEIIMIQHGGLVFLGGLIFCLLVVIAYTRAKGISLLGLVDALTPGTALGYAIGRIGCLLNGCCFGVASGPFWGIIFPSGSLAGSYFPGQPLHPTQIYAMLSMFIAAALLALLYRAKKFDGQIFFWGIILYSIYRFLIEFLRYSPVHWLQLTPSQWLVAPLFIFGLWGLLTKHAR